MIKLFIFISVAAARVPYTRNNALTARDATEPSGTWLPLDSSVPDKPPQESVGTAGDAKFQRQIWAKCDDNAKNTVVKAWKDSKKLSDALAKWKPKADFQPAMDMYMGDRSTYKDLTGFDFPKQIQDTSARHQGLYEGKSSYGDAYLWVYCNEDSFWHKHCTESDASAMIAYEQEDTWFNNWYITFCPAFFNDKWDRDWEDKLRYNTDRGLPNQIMESWGLPPEFRAASFFHETFHMSQLVTSPQAKDRSYGPEEVYQLARDRNTDAAVYNADSWLMASLAIWVQTQFNLGRPPTPEKHATGYVGNQDWNTTARVRDNVFVINEGSSNRYIPQGAQAVASDKPFSVDPSLWQVYSPDEGLASVSTVSTSTSSPTPTSSLSPPTSTSALPPPPPPAGDSCDVKYRFLFDEFLLTGKNFDADKIGKDGSGVYDSIKHCGLIREWDFHFLQNDPNGWQWSAFGHMPIWTKACIDGQLKSLGGSTLVSCSGNG